MCAGDPRRAVGGPTGRDAPERGPLWRFRDATLRGEAGALPPSWGDPQLPLVYVTFGSVTGSLEPFAPIYAATLEALADAPLRVLMTTGSAGDPASLEPWPANAHVERWWPQAEVMAHAAAVVGHGGFGTTMMALAAGVPQVVVPLFAFDQTVNAERVAAVGAGIHLGGGPRAAAELPAAVTAALSDPAYRVARRRSLPRWPPSPTPRPPSRSWSASPPPERSSPRRPARVASRVPADQRLAELCIDLPQPFPPAGSYVAAVRTGALLYLSVLPVPTAASYREGG